MKELAVVVNEFETLSEVFLYQLFAGLKQNCKITLYCYRRKFLRTQWASEFNVVGIPSFLSPGFSWYACREVFQILRGVSISRLYYSYLLDTVIRESFIYFPFIAMTRKYEDAIRRNNKKKIYSSVRGTDFTITPFLNPSVLEVYKRIVPHLSGLHFLSEELYQASLDFGIIPPRYKVIYQGINLHSHPYNRDLKRDKLRLLSIGRLHYVKGFEYAILVASELRKRGVDFELSILGDGPDREKLVYQVFSLRLSEHVFLRGALSKDEVQHYLSSSNVYIHTHLVHGLSNTMLEALACNLKVVVFDSNLKSYGQELLIKCITEVPRFDCKAMADVLQDISNEGAYGYAEDELSQCLAPYQLEKHVEGFNQFFDV